MKRNFLLAFVSVVALSGCAVLTPIGESNFSCPKDGKSDPSCRTPTAVYKSTHGEAPLGEKDLPVSWARLIGKTSGPVAGDKGAAPSPALPALQQGKAAVDPIRVQNAEPIGLPGVNAQTLGIASAATLVGRPVREPASVMRIWIAPWIDAKDDLHYPSYVFTEVQPRRWAIGRNEFAGRGMVIPHKDFAQPGTQRGAMKPSEPAQAPKNSAPNVIGAGELPAELGIPNPND